MTLPVRKIVSGGQTGVDRAALDVAIHLGIEHGGWCPLGRLAEDGTIPADYKLRETDNADYAERTERNVIDSDATLILHWGALSGGTKLTAQLARKHRRPILQVDLSDPESMKSRQVNRVQKWFVAQNIGVLNVAGPRASSRPDIASAAVQFLATVLKPAQPLDED